MLPQGMLKHQLSPLVLNDLNCRVRSTQAQPAHIAKDASYNPLRLARLDLIHPPADSHRVRHQCCRLQELDIILDCSFKIREWQEVDLARFQLLLGFGSVFEESDDLSEHVYILSYSNTRAI